MPLPRLTSFPAPFCDIPGLTWCLPLPLGTTMPISDKIFGSRSLNCSSGTRLQVVPSPPKTSLSSHNVFFISSHFLQRSVNPGEIEHTIIDVHPYEIGLRDPFLQRSPNSGTSPRVDTWNTNTRYSSSIRPLNSCSTWHCNGSIAPVNDRVCAVILMDE